MIHKSKIIHSEEGSIYSLSIKFTPEEASRSLGYFERRIDGHIDGFQYLVNCGQKHGAVAESSFLRELLHRIEFHLEPSVSPMYRKKKKRVNKRRRIKK